MINTAATHPYPGSITQVDGVRYKVLQLKPDQTALIAREGQRASFVRTVALSDMIDPDLIDDNAALWLAGMGDDVKRIALWIARHLRDANQTTFGGVTAALRRAAARDEVPAPADHLQVARILSGLGWHKIGNRIDGFDEVSLWSRVKAS